MACLSRPTIVEMLKDVIAETGLRTPRSKVKETHRLIDYGLDEDEEFGVFASDINDKFKPFGVKLTLEEVKKCKRVSNVADTLFTKCPHVLIEVNGKMRTMTNGRLDPPRKQRAKKKKPAKKETTQKKGKSR